MLAIRQPIAVQIGLVVLPLVAIVGSAAAISAAIGRSELSLNVLQFAMLTARVATVALALGLLGAAALTALLLAEVPQASAWLPLLGGGLLLMLVAVVLASAVLRHGMQGADGEWG